ncbi:hypothetical protein BOX15_Mlig017572g5 [Macrostomum lignano]|uniref:AAA+ ATPase domain-containing protein n=4 Tax=Macrostomum lignano TaxID=282301 RepID=A0A267FQ99_9PLAT|nr:hypothetical protein BOX15_Mlig017572g5 [Macrostomum lignano]
MQRSLKPPQGHQAQQQQQYNQFGIVYVKPSTREHRSSSATAIPSGASGKHRSHSAIPQPPQQPHHPDPSSATSAVATAGTLPFSPRYGLRSRQQQQQQQRCHSNTGSRNTSPAPPLAPSRLTSGRHAMPTGHSTASSGTSSSGIPTSSGKSAASSGIPQPQGRRGSAAAVVAATPSPGASAHSSLPQPQRHQRARSEQPPAQPKQPTVQSTQLPKPTKSVANSSGIPAPSASPAAKSRTASKKPPTTPQSSSSTNSQAASSSASTGRRLLSRPTIGQTASSRSVTPASSASATTVKNSNTTSSSHSFLTCDASDDDNSNSLHIDCSDLDDALNNADEMSISSSELSDAVAELERSVCAGGEGRATPDLYGLTLRKASADYGAIRSSSRLQQLLQEGSAGGGSGGEYYFSDTESVQRQQQHQLLQQHQRRKTGLAAGTSGYCTIRSAAGQAPASLPMSAAVPPTPSQSLRLPYATMRSSCSTGSFYPGSGGGGGIGGSTLSIYSAVSSSATTANEERQAMEIAKLRAELEQAQQRIASLAGQLCANTDAAEAFEQSLSDVTTKLRDLASSAERKDTELSRLRAAVGALKREEAPMQLMMQKESQQQGSQSKRHHGWLRSLRSSKKQQQQQQQQQSQAQPPPQQQQPPVVEPPALTELELQQKQQSAAELQQLRSLTEKMRADISNLKAENCRLQQLQQMRSDFVSEDHGFGGSVTDVYGGFGGGARRLSVDSTAALSAISVGDGSMDGRCDAAVVVNGAQGFDLIDGFPSSAESLRLTVLAGSSKQPIGCLPVCPRTKWETLDACCGRLFKEYLTRVDPSQGLGLGSDCVVAYEILGSNGGSSGMGLRRRGASSHSCPPPLVACMSAASAASSDPNIDPRNPQLRLYLQLHLASELETLALETLVPKPTLQRYIGLLKEHRRIALCGPAGVGKSRLAGSLAAHLSGSSSSVATFTADRRSERNLRTFLTSLNNDSSVGAVVLDNLHLVDSLSEVLSACLPPKEPPPYFIVGVMTQGGSGQAERLHAAKLELHSACNFRWVLCSAHMEPVRGFLGRCLRQRLVAAEVEAGSRLPEMSLIVDWLQDAWLKLNRLLETHAGAEASLGPGQFAACPMDSWRGAEQWFLRLWNHCLVPYVIEACREGLRLRGARAPWEDPAAKLKIDWPWGASGDAEELISIRPEDVGYEASRPPAAGVSAPAVVTGAADDIPAEVVNKDSTAANDEVIPASSDANTTDDRLMAMLMRLQEVANCGLASDLTDCV